MGVGGSNSTHIRPVAILLDEFANLRKSDVVVKFEDQNADLRVDCSPKFGESMSGCWRKRHADQLFSVSRF